MAASITRTLALLAIALISACDTAPLDTCNPSSPLHAGLSDDELEQCSETGGESEPRELDCWQPGGADYHLCWEPSTAADLFFAVNGGETFTSECSDQWAATGWAIGNWVTYVMVDVHVCGNPGAGPHAAHDGRGLAIIEGFASGAWIRILPANWPTQDMATLGGNHHYCELGVVCNAYPDAGCFCLCESDADCSGIAAEMVCLGVEDGVGDAPVCAYDGEVEHIEEPDKA